MRETRGRFDAKSGVVGRNARGHCIGIDQSRKGNPPNQTQLTHNSFQETACENCPVLQRQLERSTQRVEDLENETITLTELVDTLKSQSAPQGEHSATESVENSGVESVSELKAALEEQFEVLGTHTVVSQPFVFFFHRLLFHRGHANARGIGRRTHCGTGGRKRVAVGEIGRNDAGVGSS